VPGILRKLEDFKKPKTPSAPRAKGAPPIRKSERTAKHVHDNLSEERLAAGCEAEGLAFKFPRKRFETETMPRKKAPALKQPERFFDADTLAIGVSWFAIIHRQAELKPWVDICEDMAFNLAEECIAIESIRGADASTLETVSKTAFSGIDAKVGWDLAFNRILSQLKTGDSKFAERIDVALSQSCVTLRF
jgi:hypothetical protein